MHKFVAFAAVVSATALIAGAAGATDLRVVSPSTPAVHVALAGKTTAQIDAEIRAAANTVCTGADSACIESAIDDAEGQLRAISRATRVSTGAANVEVARAAPSTVRVSIKGKTQAALDAEIAQAAHAVCKATNATGSEYTVCVSEAISDAKAQLQFIAQADQPREVASN